MKNAILKEDINEISFLINIVGLMPSENDIKLIKKHIHNQKIQCIIYKKIEKYISLRYK